MSDPSEAMDYCVVRSGRTRPWLVPLLLLQLLQLAVQQRAHDAAPPSKHPCERECEAGRPMTCHYDFHVENYYSMSKACYGCPWNATDCGRPDCIPADGVLRALVSVNRQLPGPSLQVCLGDRVEVTVHNRMPEQSTSVHWHGMLQRGTPYMDGVPFVTQCPVPSLTSFRYSFRADNAGTHFWHSHTGCQRADGAVGLLTVRVPRTHDPHADRYDEDLPEHGILVWDWTHQPASSKFLAHHHAGADNKADSVLINGKGAFQRFDSPAGSVFTPREEFHVKQGRRYRFRLVNAGFLNCPLELSIDNHTMLVIASDGADVQPVEVDSLVSYAGERWDVVVEANRPVDNYWVRLHGLLDCGPRRAHQAAVLRYEGAPSALDPAGPAPSYDVIRNGRQVNSLNKGSAHPNTLTAAELHALPPRTPSATGPDPALKAEADVQLFVSYDFYAVDNPHIHRAGLYGISQVANSPARVFTPQLNHISLSLPAVPLLPGRDSLRPGATCNETSLLAQGKHCETEYCECTHVVRVPLGGVLEIVLVDQGVRYDANHPFHLHGHAFRVVALERLGNSTSVDEVRRLDEAGNIARNLIDPPTKDTVTVPDGGYTVLRVHADNPGYWLFHCHIEFHVELGMALVVMVGEHEDMPPVPRGFPQCGNWSSWQGDDVDDVGAGLGEEHHVGEDIVPGNHLAGGPRGLDLGRLVGRKPAPREVALASSSAPTTTPSTTTSSSSAPSSISTGPPSSPNSPSTTLGSTTPTTQDVDTSTEPVTDGEMMQDSAGTTTTASITPTLLEHDVKAVGMDAKDLYDVHHVTDEQEATTTTAEDAEAEANTGRADWMLVAAPVSTPSTATQRQGLLISDNIMRVPPPRPRKAAVAFERPPRTELLYDVVADDVPKGEAVTAGAGVMRTHAVVGSLVMSLMAALIAL